MSRKLAEIEYRWRRLAVNGAPIPRFRNAKVRGSIPLGSTTRRHKQLNREFRRQIGHDIAAQRVGAYAEAVYQSDRHDERHSGADQSRTTGSRHVEDEAAEKSPEARSGSVQCQ
jgi:hypothetical protein